LQLRNDLGFPGEEAMQISKTIANTFTSNYQTSNRNEKTNSNSGRKTFEIIKK
jgi:hypothetical protein